MSILTIVLVLWAIAMVVTLAVWIFIRGHASRYETFVAITPDVGETQAHNTEKEQKQSA